MCKNLRDLETVIKIVNAVSWHLRQIILKHVYEFKSATMNGDWYENIGKNIC